MVIGVDNKQMHDTYLFVSRPTHSVQESIQHNKNNNTATQQTQVLQVKCSLYLRHMACCVVFHLHLVEASLGCSDVISVLYVCVFLCVFIWACFRAFQHLWPQQLTKDTFIRECCWVTVYLSFDWPTDTSCSVLQG